jgi:RNA polymerase sigma-70 factor (ECF subfamily)
MSGSLHEAEDLVQEAYLRAWRSFDGFDGRGSLRAWLYRIATNTSLDALAKRKAQRRLLPEQHGPALNRPPEGAPPTEIAWLEPYPDSEIEAVADAAPGPEARYAARESVRLAFVAAIQDLPPRQRAALLLTDVLGWSAAEAATLLGGTVASINSALQRARETLAKRYAGGRPLAAPQPDAAQQTLLTRYLKAGEGHELDDFVALLKEDATFTMPPWLEWFAGREAIRAFFTVAWQACGGLKLVPTQANGQPAFAVYARQGDGTLVAHGVQVLTIEDGEITSVTAFLDCPHLFAAFGLPAVFTDALA